MSTVSVKVTATETHAMVAELFASNGEFLGRRLFFVANDKNVRSIVGNNVQRAICA